MNLKRRLAPVDGIFAVRVDGVGDAYRSMACASVGNRPTIGGGKTLLEVFIFDFDDDIYGCYITVNFVARLREERMYENVDLMARQMHQDVRDARVLRSPPESLTLSRRLDGPAGPGLSADLSQPDRGHD